MDAGYSILLERNEAACAQNASRLGVIHPPFLPGSEDDQFFDQAPLNQEAEVDNGHRTGLSHTVNNVKGKAAPVKTLLQSLLLPLIILLVLVPGSLLFVDHVRRGDDCTGRRSWRGQDPSSRDAERPEALIDVAGSSLLQPVVTARSNLVGIAKCEGWRDWVDYEGGWKGCIP